MHFNINLRFQNLPFQKILAIYHVHFYLVLNNTACISLKHFKDCKNGANLQNLWILEKAGQYKTEMTPSV